MGLAMKNYYLFATVSAFSAILAFNFYSTDESENEEAALSNNEVKYNEDSTLVSSAYVKERKSLEMPMTSSNENVESNSIAVKKIQRSSDLDNFSENVSNVRDQISLGIAPEKEDFINAMREVYKDRPASFKRNLERNFQEALNPTPYCNAMRKNWAEPYVSEINAGYVFINEDLWQRNSPSNKAQLAQYLSKCTQDSQPFELIAQSSGYTVAYYSLNEGYQSANL